MLDVHNTKNYLNYDIDNKVNYDKLKTVESDSDIKQNVSSKIENSSASSDSIEINQKDQNVINAKKVKDAYFKTCSEFDSDDNPQDNMSGYWCDVVFLMKKEGMAIPPSSSINSEFIDEVKDFVKNKVLSKPGTYPSGFPNFLNFCDSFKQKLKQNGL